MQSSYFKFYLIRFFSMISIIIVNSLNEMFLKNNKYNENLILFHFDKFDKALRRKKLSHFSKSYLKIFEFFEFLNMKRKIVIKFYIDDFFEHFDNDNDFDMLLKTRRI